jgi:hypothetical protein
MPRKVDPHRFEQSDAWPTDFIESFGLPATVAEFLPDSLSGEQSYHALEGIRYALGEYEWEMKVGPHRYSRAEVSKGLKDFIEAGDFGHGAIGALNQRAYECLHFLIPDRGARRWFVEFGAGAPPEDAIREGVNRALKMLNGQRGPEKSIPLYFLVTRLCHVYEEITDNRVTHHTKTKDLGYTQESQTAAGQFVTGIIQLAFPDVRSTRINRYLRAFVKDRPEPF